MSIVNFEDKINERSSDVILSLLNLQYNSKLSGVPNKESLSKIEVLSSNLFSNLIRHGKVSQDDIDAYKALLPDENYFSHENVDLDVAKKMCEESIEFAIQDFQTRVEQAKPIFNEESYAPGPKRLS